MDVVIVSEKSESELISSVYYDNANQIIGNLYRISNFNSGKCFFFQPKIINAYPEILFIYINKKKPVQTLCLHY